MKAVAPSRGGSGGAMGALLANWACTPSTLELQYAREALVAAPAKPSLFRDSQKVVKVRSKPRQRAVLGLGLSPTPRADGGLVFAEEDFTGAKLDAAVERYRQYALGFAALRISADLGDAGQALTGKADAAISLLARLVDGVDDILNHVDVDNNYIRSRTVRMIERKIESEAFRKHLHVQDHEQLRKMVADATKTEVGSVAGWSTFQKFALMMVAGGPSAPRIPFLTNPDDAVPICSLLERIKLREELDQLAPAQPQGAAAIFGTAAKPPERKPPQGGTKKSTSTNNARGRLRARAIEKLLSSQTPFADIKRWLLTYAKIVAGQSLARHVRKPLDALLDNPAILNDWYLIDKTVLEPLSREGVFVKEALTSAALGFGEKIKMGAVAVTMLELFMRGQIALADAIAAPRGPEENQYEHAQTHYALALAVANRMKVVMQHCTALEQFVDPSLMVMWRERYQQLMAPTSPPSYLYLRLVALMRAVTSPDISLKKIVEGVTKACAGASVDIRDFSDQTWPQLPFTKEHLFKVALPAEIPPTGTPAFEQAARAFGKRLADARNQVTLRAAA